MSTLDWLAVTASLVSMGFSLAAIHVSLKSRRRNRD